MPLRCLFPVETFPGPPVVLGWNHHFLTASWMPSRPAKGAHRVGEPRGSRVSRNRAWWDLVQMLGSRASSGRAGSEDSGRCVRGEGVSCAGESLAPAWSPAQGPPPPAQLPPAPLCCGDPSSWNRRTGPAGPPAGPQTATPAAGPTAGRPRAGHQIYVFSLETLCNLLGRLQGFSTNGRAVPWSVV